MHSKLHAISTAGRLWLGASLMAAAVFTGCGSNHAELLAERRLDEANHLQQHVRKTALATDETKRADDFLSKGTAKLKDGDEEAADQMADMSVTLYRLALARKEMADNQAKVDGLKVALAKDKDQLQTYQEILEEIKSRRKP